MTTTTDCALSREEITRFHADGYLGPYTLCSPDEMAVIRAKIDWIMTQKGPNAANPLPSRHMDQRTVYDLAAHPTIIDRINSLMGPDLVLWATYFWVKKPGDKEIPWHQDLNYWPIDPPLNLSAWIAIDEATVENSCVNLIPGSHKKVLRHVKSSDEMAFQEMAEGTSFEAKNIVNMVLKPGQFFIFSERTLHQSNANRSQQRRLGMTCRFTVPFVEIKHDKLHAGHRAIVVRGTDHHQLNNYQPPPTE